MTTAVTLSPVAVQDFFANGVPLVSGKLFVYAAGSLTKITTYTDSTGSTPQTNPIILNSRGEPENTMGASVGIWVPPGTPYKLVFTTPTDTDPPTTPIWTVDNIGGLVGGSGVGISFDTIAQFQAASLGSTIQSVSLTGYYAAGDGGAALYSRSGSSGPGAGLVQSADGQWWVLADRAPNQRQFGAKGIGSGFNDGPAVQAWANFAIPNGLPMRSVAGRYSLQTRYTAGNGLLSLCLLPTGYDIKIYGEGIFTIPDAFSSSGAANDYSFFVAADSTPSGNLDISGIEIDGNGSANLVIDSGTNVRRGYGFDFWNGGGDANFHDCTFINMAGRNVIIASTNSSTPGWTSVRIHRVLIENVGGAIAGNEHQNDHSSFYVEAAESDINDNFLSNSNTLFDPNTSPFPGVVAIEDHSARQKVGQNTVVNYGGAGNCVAFNFDVVEAVWNDNQFLGMKANVFQPVTSGATIRRLVMEGNVLETDNTTYTGGSGFYQNGSNNTTAIGHLIFNGNSVYCLNQSQTSNFIYGFYLTAADAFDVQHNMFSWWQAAGNILLNHPGTLSIKDGTINNNTYKNCGMQNALSIPWAIYLLNANTNKVFSNIVIGPNNLIKADVQSVGNAPFPCRGIQVTGGGNLQDILIYTPRTDGTILRTQRVTFTTTTNNRNVVQVPDVVRLATASSPIRGFFDIAGETITHTDPAPSGTFGRVVTTAGSGSEALWGTATAYAVGEWIHLSTSKVIIYTVAGTSDATTEPTPSVLGQQYTDGTASFLYIDTGAPVLKTYGAISA